MPFPKVHAFGANSLKLIRQYRNFLRRYCQFLSFRFSRSKTAPDVELVLYVSGYKILRYFHKYYAIPQSEGEFIQDKAESGGYSSSFSGVSVDTVFRKIAAASGKANQLVSDSSANAYPYLVLEGFNGYNIIRLSEEFHAILQSEGAFEYAKLLSSKYSHSFSGRSLTEVKELILASIDGGPNQSEGV